MVKSFTLNIATDGPNQFYATYGLGAYQKYFENKKILGILPTSTVNNEATITAGTTIFNYVNGAIEDGTITIVDIYGRYIFYQMPIVFFASWVQINKGIYCFRPSILDVRKCKILTKNPTRLKSIQIEFAYVSI